METDRDKDAARALKDAMSLSYGHFAEAVMFHREDVVRQERAAIVAWLRAEAMNTHSDDWDLFEAAGSIERGEHNFVAIERLDR